MRFNRLDLNLLVCLDALIADKSVSKAAERVFLGQPAMSSALGRLREHFGDELLVKVGRSMVLSPLAQGLAKPVRDLLLQTQAVTSLRPEFDPAKSERKISVIASDYVTNVFMTALLPRLSSLAPRIKLELRSMGVNFQEAFDSGEADMMVVPDMLLVKEHPSEVLFDDSFSCVVWSGGALANGALSAKQYLSAGHVATQWGAGRLLSLDEQALQRRGQFRRIEIVVPDFSLAPRMVVGTDRIATVQTRLARLMARRWPLKVLPSPVPLPRLVECAQWHKYVDRDPAIIWFRTLLKAVAGQLGAPAAAQASARRKARA